MHHVAKNSLAFGNAYAMECVAEPGRPTLAQSLTLVGMSLGYGVVQLDVTIVNTL